jgi:eukaryotic-like serine/threonine-protein kinase
VVYRGFDPVINRTIALKTIAVGQDASLAGEFRSRLQREAAAAGALTHPNIVTVFDVVEEAGTLAIAMEFVEGRTLGSIIADRGPLPFGEALDLIAQICAALDHAATFGIVHRDIKPANILVGRDLKPKIADFGIARMPDSNLTLTGMVLGSAGYMSPEQVRGQRLDSRSDLFAAATVFYEMVTKEQPFRGNDLASTVYRIVHEAATPANVVNPTLPASVAAVMERALAKRPEDRYESGAAFVAALRDAGGGAAMPVPLASRMPAPEQPTVQMSAGDIAAVAAGVPGVEQALAIAVPGMPGVPASASAAKPAARSGDGTGKRRSLGLAVGVGGLLVAIVAGWILFRQSTPAVPESATGPTPATTPATVPTATPGASGGRGVKASPSVPRATAAQPPTERTAARPPAPAIEERPRMSPPVQSAASVPEASATAAPPVVPAVPSATPVAAPPAATVASATPAPPPAQPPPVPSAPASVPGALRAILALQFDGPPYPVVVYVDDQAVGRVENAQTLSVAAGTSRVRVVADSVFYARDLGAISLTGGERHTVTMPTVGAMTIAVKGDYTGVKMFLDDKAVPSPYPAQMPRVAAGSHAVRIEWVAGALAGKRLEQRIEMKPNGLIRIQAVPENDRIEVQQIR